jgi:hypothetical protein
MTERDEALEAPYLSDSDPRLQLQAAKWQQVAEARFGSASENKTRAVLDEYSAKNRQRLAKTGFAARSV